MAKCGVQRPLSNKIDTRARGAKAPRAFFSIGKMLQKTVDKIKKEWYNTYNNSYKWNGKSTYFFLGAKWMNNRTPCEVVGVSANKLFGF